MTHQNFASDGGRVVTDCGTETTDGATKDGNETKRQRYRLLVLQHLR